MKKLELIFAAILVPLDYLTLLLAATLAYFLRFESFVRDIRPVVFELSYQDFIKIAALAACLWLMVFALNGLYAIKRHSIIRDLSKIIVACSAATLIIVVAFFFNFQLFSSRLIILTVWLLSIILVSAERVMIYYVKKFFYKKNIGVRLVVVIGDNKTAQEIIDDFKNKPSYGFRIVDNFSNFSQPTEEKLNQLAEYDKLDDVILADPNLAEEQKNRLVDFCTENQLNYKYAASLLETKLINFDLSTVAGVPLIEVKQTRLDGWGRILKRIFDLLASLFLLIILSPLFLLIGLLVVVTSIGPVVVKLERIGANGRRFKLYKFRSMIKGAHQLKPVLFDHNERADGPLFKMENDPRITRFGKFIRRWSFDELPQLFNVFSGQMSLVGPRPHEPEEVARYQTSDKKLLAVKPGLTGMAQVTGRSDLLWDEEVRLDTYYLENWSLGLDVQILLRTPKAVFSRHGAV
jgi:exopolysaccharide biosynthesis polyprenyl glycosylphosphotransferase